MRSRLPVPAVGWPGTMSGASPASCHTPGWPGPGFTGTQPVSWIQYSPPAPFPNPTQPASGPGAPGPSGARSRFTGSLSQIRFAAGLVGSRSKAEIART